MLSAAPRRLAHLRICRPASCIGSSNHGVRTHVRAPAALRLFSAALPAATGVEAGVHPPDVPLFPSAAVPSSLPALAGPTVKHTSAFRVAVALVAPQQPVNVGAVARLMSAFGHSELYISPTDAGFDSILPGELLADQSMEGDTMTLTLAPVHFPYGLTRTVAGAGSDGNRGSDGGSTAPPHGWYVPAQVAGVPATMTDWIDHGWLTVSPAAAAADCVESDEQGPLLGLQSAAASALASSHPSRLEALADPATGHAPAPAAAAAAATTVSQPESTPLPAPAPAPLPPLLRMPSLSSSAPLSSLLATLTRPSTLAALLPQLLCPRWAAAAEAEHARAHGGPAPAPTTAAVAAAERDVRGFVDAVAAPAWAHPPPLPSLQVSAARNSSFHAPAPSVPAPLASAFVRDRSGVRIHGSAPLSDVFTPHTELVIRLPVAALTSHAAAAAAAASASASAVGWVDVAWAAARVGQARFQGAHLAQWSPPLATALQHPAPLLPSEALDAASGLTLSDSRPCARLPLARDHPCVAITSASYTTATTNGSRVLHRARAFTDLEELLGSFDVVIGTSAMLRPSVESLRAPVRLPWELNWRALLSPGEVDDDTPPSVLLVLGRESNGLTVHELSLCDAIVTLPGPAPNGGTNHSLNMAQAAGALLYEVARTEGLARVESGEEEQQSQAVGSTETGTGWHDPYLPLSAPFSSPSPSSLTPAGFDSTLTEAPPAALAATAAAAAAAPGAGAHCPSPAALPVSPQARASAYRVIRSVLGGLDPRFTCRGSAPLQTKRTPPPRATGKENTVSESPRLALALDPSTAPDTATVLAADAPHHAVGLHAAAAASGTIPLAGGWYTRPHAHTHKTRSNAPNNGSSSSTPSKVEGCVGTAAVLPPRTLHRGDPAHPRGRSLAEDSAVALRKALLSVRLSSAELGGVRHAFEWVARQTVSAEREVERARARAEEAEAGAEKARERAEKAEREAEDAKAALLRMQAVSGKDK